MSFLKRKKKQAPTPNTESTTVLSLNGGPKCGNIGENGFRLKRVLGNGVIVIGIRQGHGNRFDREEEFSVGETFWVAEKLYHLGLGPKQNEIVISRTL